PVDATDTIQTYTLSLHDALPIYFQYLGAVGIINYSPGNETGNAIAQTSLENQALSWEKTKGYDLGFELGLFSDRVNIVFDYYDRSEEHTSELQSRENLVCRLLLE